MACEQLVSQDLTAENTNAKTELGIMLLGTAVLIIISSILISCWQIAKVSSASPKVDSPLCAKFHHVSYIDIFRIERFAKKQQTLPQTLSLVDLLRHASGHVSWQKSAVRRLATWLRIPPRLEEQVPEFNPIELKRPAHVRSRQ